MKMTTILFDLDGTLLPMDQDQFVKVYFGLLAQKMAPLGYEPKKMLEAVYAGTKAMVKNDGAGTNEEAFWKTFCAVFGEKAREDAPHFEAFYREEFQQAKAACRIDPRAAEAIFGIKAQGYRVALATNPLFPQVATHSRVRWIGLEPQDFELVTTYEDYHFCKPNLKYYDEILEKLHVDPKECLMVGNDVDEDMIAEKLGMRVFLLTDCLINRSGKDIAQYPHGSFGELQAYVKDLVAQ